MKINPIIPPAKLAVGWLTMFLLGTELFIFSPLLPTLAVNYNVSSNTAGLCVTTFSLAYMISAPLLGHVSDCVGKRRVLIYCLLVFGTANLFTAYTRDFSFLLFLRLLAGASAGGVSPSLYALVGDTAPPDRRATWLALTVSGLLISLALGASPAALVGGTFGWTVVFVALAVFSLALAALNGWVWRSQCCYRAATRAAHDRIDVACLLPRLLPVILWSTGLYGVYTYLGTGLVAYGFSKSQVAQAVMLYGCGAIAGALIGGRLADRLGARYTAGVSLAGLCICLFLLLPALHAGVLVELTFGLSAAVAQLFFPAQQSGLVNDFPARRGAVLAWNNSALFLGISLGSLVGGEAIAISGFDMTLMVGAAIVLIGCIVNWLVVPRAIDGLEKPS